MLKHTSTKLTFRAVLLTTAAAVSASGPVTMDERYGPPHARVYTLDPSDRGNPEGIAYDTRTGAFYVSTIFGGTIYRGTLDHPTVTPYIEGSEGLSAAGLEIWQGQLFVAGADGGDVRVYDIQTGALLATFSTGVGGFLNDLVVTPRGDVYVTDSWRPSLWKITAEQVASGSGVPIEIPLGPEVDYAGDWTAFYLNGIVETLGGRRLIAVSSQDGKLYRIDLDASAPNGRQIQTIDIEPVWGDGLLIDGGHLVAVTFDEPGLAFIRLNHDASAGEIVRRLTDPTFRDPSTVASARNFYLVANFDPLQNRTPFTIAAVPRE